MSGRDQARRRSNSAGALELRPESRRPGVTHPTGGFREQLDPHEAVDPSGKPADRTPLVCSGSPEIAASANRRLLGSRRAVEPSFGPAATTPERRPQNRYGAGPGSDWPGACLGASELGSLEPEMASPTPEATWRLRRRCLSTRSSPLPSIRCMA